MSDIVPSNTSKGKVRKNLSLSQFTVDKGIAIQRAEKRPSFTNVCEWLIDREYSRRFPQGAGRK